MFRISLCLDCGVLVIMHFVVFLIIERLLIVLVVLVLSFHSGLELTNGHNTS